jgi:7-carboxy-7-deazaguanine synthase
MNLENQIIDDGRKLPLIDDFYTLQGEGFHTGKAAYFLRVGGCDIGCRWCDSKVSWKFGTHQLVDVDKIVEKALSFPAKSIVLTGGEPLNYNLNYLCNELKKNKIQTYLETSGSGTLTGIWDWICLSPKKNSPPEDSIIPKANELKIIVFDYSDFEWAEKYARLVKPDCQLYLQPEWSKHKTITNDIVDYIKLNPKWKISIQAHKFMKIP